MAECSLVLCLVVVYAGSWRAAGWNGYPAAAHHAPPHHASLAVRFVDRQRRLQDQGDSRNHGRFCRRGLGNAAQLYGKSRHGVGHERRHHAVHLPHLLCYARGTHFSICRCSLLQLAVFLSRRCPCRSSPATGFKLEVEVVVQLLLQKTYLFVMNEAPPSCVDETGPRRFDLSSLKGAIYISEWGIVVVLNTGWRDCVPFSHGVN